LLRTIPLWIDKSYRIFIAKSKNFLTIIIRSLNGKKSFAHV